MADRHTAARLIYKKSSETVVARNIWLLRPTHHEQGEQRQAPAYVKGTMMVNEVKGWAPRTVASKSTAASSSSTATREAELSGPPTGAGHDPGVTRVTSQQKELVRQIRRGKGSTLGRAANGPETLAQFHRTADQALTSRQPADHSQQTETGLTQADEPSTSAPQPGISQQSRGSWTPRTRPSSASTSSPTEPAAPIPIGEERKPRRVALASLIKDAAKQKEEPNSSPQNLVSTLVRQRPVADRVKAVHPNSAYVAQSLYEKEALPLLPYSDHTTAIYPTCLARNSSNIFVQSPDGKARRFPSDSGGGGYWHMCSKTKLPEQFGRRFLEQLTFIYDAPQEATHKTVAGYQLDKQQATMTFQVHGKPIQSVMKDVGAFPLPKGKWMIPQLDLRGCTFAAEEMLLAEGKTTKQVQQQLADFKPKLERRNDDEVLESLAERSNRRPELIKGDHELTDSRSLQLLQQKLAQHGPCILESESHTRILDKIEHVDGEPIWTIRDPFTANVLQIKPYEHFLKAGTADAASRKLQKPLQQNAPWTAIFLTTPTNDR